MGLRLHQGRFFSIIALVILSGLLIISACTTRDTSVPTMTRAEELAEPTLEPTVASEPSPTEPADVQEVDNCVACHTDKQQLIDTADPEEEPETESSGEG